MTTRTGVNNYHVTLSGGGERKRRKRIGILVLLPRFNLSHSDYVQNSCQETLDS